MELPKALLNEIWDYCRANGITNIDEFTIGLVQKGFTVEKYGATPIKDKPRVEGVIETPPVLVAPLVVPPSFHENATTPTLTITQPISTPDIYNEL